MYRGKKVACLIMAAGQGKRMGKGRAKQFREVGGKSVIERTLLTFANHPLVDDILIVTDEDDRMLCNSLGLAKGNGKMKAVCLGGATREESVWNGLKVLAALRGDEPEGVNGAASDLVLIQDAVRPFTSRELITRVTEAAYQYGAAIPCVPVKDTVKIAEGSYVAKTLPRETLVGAQTPQAFQRGVLASSMNKGRKRSFPATDDASYVEKYGGNVRIVEGEARNIKITTIEDMATAEMLAAAQDDGFRPSASYFLTGSAMPEGFTADERGRPASPVPGEAEPGEAGAPAGRNAPPAGRKSPCASPCAPCETCFAKAALPEEALPRIGEGYDVHMLVPNRPLVLGGVTVPYEKGLEGHSDADVMTHAVMDALLGASSLGDIGQIFPDRDPAYENAYSLALLEVVRRLLEKNGYQVGNLDVTLAAQEPKISPYLPSMRANYAKILRVPEDRISVKATTTERLGFVGRGEGMAATAVCMLVPVPRASRAAGGAPPVEPSPRGADLYHAEPNSTAAHCDAPLGITPDRGASPDTPSDPGAPNKSGWTRLTF